MITYEKLLKNPQVTNSLIGMSLTDFEDLCRKFAHAHRARMSGLHYTQRAQTKRRRVVGAGPKHKYPLCDRLLMTLFWLRAYTTYSVLGTLYDLNKTTIEEYLKNVIDTLSVMTCFSFERPQVDIPKLRSVEELINAFPDVLLLMDADEPAR